MRKRIGLVLLLGCLLPVGLTGEEPWSISADHPTVSATSTPHRHHHHGFLGFYQTWISSFDGPRCRMNPTCSGYAVQSFRRYGWLTGWLMTVDRVMHEGDKHDVFYATGYGRRRRFEDPPSRNVVGR